MSPVAPDTATETSQATMIDGDEEYAVVEIMGHRRHAGRILDVERFGTKFLRIDVPTEGDFAKGHTSHFYGGASIFSVTFADLATVCRLNRPYSPPGRYLPGVDEDGADIGANAGDGDF